MAFQILRSVRRWDSPASATTNAANLVGACRRLEQYAGQPELVLQNHSMWRDAQLYYQKLATSHVPVGAELTLQQMRDAIAKLSKQASLVLLLGWYHAARAANTEEMKIEEMKIAPATDLHPGDRGYQWSVTWMRAKTSAKVGPYNCIVAICFRELQHRFVFREL